MTQELLLAVSREALWLMVVASLPPVGASLLVGLVMSVVQASTQVQEGALSSVPKLGAAVLALVLAGPWIGAQLARFTTRLLLCLPQVAG